MKNILIFCLLIMSITSVSYAQEEAIATIQLKGVVRDTLTKTPLSGTHLLRRNGEGVTTDNNGFFEITISETEDLLVTHLGYLNKRTDRLSEKEMPSLFIEIWLQKDTITLGVVEINPWPIKEDFKPALLSLDTARNLPDQPVRLPGVVYTPGKMIPPPATVMSPVSFLYERFGKKARRDRKMDRYRKKLHLK